MAKNRPNPRKSNNPPLSARERRIVWHIPPDIKTTYVTNLTVQQTHDEFIVSFYEIVPPLVLREEDLDKVPDVVAECVARFVVTPARMQTFIQALADSFERYENDLDQHDGDEDGSTTIQE